MSRQYPKSSRSKHSRKRAGLALAKRAPLYLSMAVQLLDTLPETDAHVIFQMDSWYTCKALWDKALEKNITLIGAMKTNCFSVRVDYMEEV